MATKHKWGTMTVRKKKKVTLNTAYCGQENSWRKHILLLTPRLLPSRFSQQQDDASFCAVCCRVTAHPMCFWGTRPDANPGTPNLKVPAPYRLRLS